MPEQLRISGKDLGAVAMPEFCPRCFWIKRNVPSGLPFQIFPGIFSSIDSYTKHVVHGWFDRHKSAPEWLADLGPLSGYVDPPHHSKFRFLHAGTNILLTGSPDGVFVLPDGSYMIVDYKTAKHSGSQDDLFPIYETQLNAYAVIGEACGLTPVSKLALIYTEPITDKKVASTDCAFRRFRPLEPRRSRPSFREDSGHPRSVSDAGDYCFSQWPISVNLCCPFFFRMDSPRRAIL